MEVGVEPGEIRVASVEVMLDWSLAKVWYVDLHSKYAEILTYSNEEVLLHAGERTLRLDESLRGKPTAIRLDLPDDWSLIVDCARYTCRIVAYRPDRPQERANG